MSDFADPEALVREILKLTFLPKPDGTYRTAEEIEAEMQHREQERMAPILARMAELDAEIEAAGIAMMEHAVRAD